MGASAAIARCDRRRIPAQYVQRGGRRVVVLYFSPIEFGSELSAVIYPFRFKKIFSTPKFDELLDFDLGNFSIKDVDFEQFEENKLIYANAFILSTFYNIDVKPKNDMIYVVLDRVTGLNRYYKALINSSFCTIYPTRPLKAFSDQELKELADHIHDVRYWDKNISYNDFEFRGFIILKFLDVTQNEVVSSLRYDLLQKNAIIAKENFAGLQHHLQELFGIPDLRVGLISFDESQGDLQMNQGPKIWNSLISQQEIMQIMQEDPEFESELINHHPETGCIYHKMAATSTVQWIDDLAAIERQTSEEVLYRKGFRSVMVTPLRYDDKCLGGLELATPRPNELNHHSVLMLQQIIPVFSLAAKRSIEELNSQLQAVIKEQYTALHPSVEWKFVHLALKRQDALNKGEMVENEPIVFKNVFPMYGQSDIRNSSLVRNESIQSDMIEQLVLAKQVMESSYKRRKMDIVEEICFRVDQFVSGIADGIGSGDEITILNFLKNEIEPLIKHFVAAGLIDDREAQAYFSRLDPALGIVYKRRKAFEDSLTRINETVSAYIQAQEVHAQQIFPHYFEKYKTDGVEYNIYIGSSITPSVPFDSVYLSNLRLWQLKLTANIARITHEIKSKLTMPLDTTHLILVNSSPIDVRFREDEKKFDVDGAYNIRYEIIKKRIDKAHIKGTDERITQPNKIAIVYSQDKEAQEYHRYIAFLQHQGLLEPTVEEYEIEQLQGVNGLKVLRVAVNMDQQSNESDFAEKVIRQVMEKVDG